MKKAREGKIPVVKRLNGKRIMQCMDCGRFFLRSRYSLRFFCPQCGSIRIKEEGRLVG